MTMWGILTHLLYPEGIRSLGVEVGGIFVFLRASSKPAEATGGARQRFIGLDARGARDKVSYRDFVIAWGSQAGREAHLLQKNTGILSHDE